MADKLLKYDVAMKSTKTVWQMETPRCYTGDENTVTFDFNITDLEAADLVGVIPNVYLYMRDGSFFQNGPDDGVEITGTKVNYTMKGNEGKHSGIAKAQLVLVWDDGINPAEKLTSQLYVFEVVSGLENKVAIEVMVQDWTTLTREARTFIDTSSDEVDALKGELQTAINTANASLGEFDVALETGIVAANLAEKLEDFEEINNSRLLSTERQLAEAATKAELDETNVSVNLKADKTYVDTKIATVVSGSPKGVYATLALLQSAFPTGNTNVYVVSADGHWYYWNSTSSAWMDGGVYQSTQIAEEGILLKNLSDTMLDKIHNLKEYNRVSMALSDFATTNTTALSLDGAYIKGTSSGEKVVIKQYKNWGIAANDKILVNLKIKGNKSGNIIIYLMNNNAGSVVASTTQSISTTERVINLVLTGASICNGILFSCTDFVTSGDFVEIDDIVVVALTPIFGTGSEPTGGVARAYLWASDNKYTDAYDLLMADTIKGTTVYTLKGTGIYTITHKALLSEATLTIRTDVITIAGSIVTETRTAFTGDTVNITTNTSTLITEVV